MRGDFLKGLLASVLCGFIGGFIANELAQYLGFGRYLVLPGAAIGGAVGWAIVAPMQLWRMLVHKWNHIVAWRPNKTGSKLAWRFLKETARAVNSDLRMLVLFDGALGILVGSLTVGTAVACCIGAGLFFTVHWSVRQISSARHRRLAS